MSNLSFRIILVPKSPCSSEDKTKLLSEVEKCIKNCELEELAVEFFEPVKHESEQFNEIEELIVQVHAKAGGSYPKHKHSQYLTFCSKWNVQSQNLPCSCSYVALYSKDSFVNARKSKTVINCLDFGFGVLPHDRKFYKYTSFSTSSLPVHFYHDTRNVVVQYNSGGCPFEISFSYAHIRNIFVDQGDSIVVRMYFDLFNPPIIQRVEQRVGPTGIYFLKHRNLNMQWSVNRDVLGRANVLSLSFIDRSSELSFRDMNSDLEKIIANLHYRCSEKSILFSRITDEPATPPADPLLRPGMDFSSLYLLTAILKRNFLLSAQSSDVHRGLSETIYSKTNQEALERALTDVLFALDSGKILNLWHAIESRYVHYVAGKEAAVDFRECVVPSKCRLIRRITVTPTRLLLWRPEVLFGNRVLRKFDSEYAVRVSFREDNLYKLSNVAMYADSGFLDNTVKEPMTNGLLIGSRHYEFLAWSNSQIRDHGVWMYARDAQGKTSADIRKWMGDFSHIHNVPKYMARMGQCFSQTEDALSVPLDESSVRTVPDVEGGYDPENRKPYCFSDGIGRISTELARKVHEALGHDKLCSAFQIRYGGYKGMLAVDPTLRHVQIEFRESMKKFNCPNSIRLEIARTSSPVPLQLNRPFITILNDLGVRHRVFLRLQENMLKNLTDMLFDEKKAAESLKGGIYDYEELSKSGIFLTTEPYFRTILLALHRHKIDYLKSKANVSIDPQYGRNMLGVMDETGILNYGQVFVQYTVDISYGETTRDTKILKGEVLVTKNPCHYPGDVRKFQAVNVPALRHHVDCIVFPRRGSRPHPNEMAGSDMDGDEYSVLWFPDLIFYAPNRPPAHFPSFKSPDVPAVQVPQMIFCLQEYIKKDQIGTISHAHLALADMHGVDSDICKAVARKISIAVDFAKTGHTAFLDRSEKPKEYPDFMEKNFREEYKSIKALGKMYRICKDYETENQETVITYESIKVDPDLVYPGWEKYKDAALKAKNKYNSILGSLLSNYGIEHESEAFSGAFSKLHCRFQERNDRMDVEKVVLICLKKLVKDTLDGFNEEFASSGDVSATETAMLQKASAWYVTTYSDPEAKFLSFAWTVSKYLASIKIRHTLGEFPPFSPAITELDEKIIECEKNNLLPDCREIGSVWEEYRILCEPPDVFRRALRVLILWAQDEEIIERPGWYEGLLYVSVFVRLVFLVAEKQLYVAKEDKPVNSVRGTRAFSAGKLCIEFLKFCSSLRFYNQNDISQVLPFRVYKYSRLAKRAVVSYHRFALSGKFRNLYFDAKVKDDLIDMKPFHIDSKIFQQRPISEASLRKAEEALVKYSGVAEVGLNEYHQTKKVCVRALGSESAIKDLKSILRKKHKVLTELFTTGVMPEDDLQNSTSLKRNLEAFGESPIVAKLIRLI